MFAQKAAQGFSRDVPVVARLSRLIDKDREPAQVVNGEHAMRVNGELWRCDLSDSRGCLRVGRVLRVSGEHALEAFDRWVNALLSHADDSVRPS